MRKLTFYVLATALSILVWGPAPQAHGQSPRRLTASQPVNGAAIAASVEQPPAIDARREFFFFFRHLANLDAAANQAEAEGNAAASEWRTHDQRAAGLTDEQGAILKQVAYGCNQVLRDANQPIGPMETVSAAMDELRLRLGEEVFKALATYVHATVGPDIDLVSGPPSQSTGQDVAGQAVQAQINVFSHISKLSGNQVFAECDTAMDAATAQYYPGTESICDLYSSGTQYSIPIPCPSGPGQCLGTFPAGPGTQHQVRSGHNLGLYTGTCGGVAGSLLDPLHYCGGQGTPIPVFQISGTLYAAGDYKCWTPHGYGACGIAQTFGRVVTFVDISPYTVTLGANQQQRFSTNMPAFLFLFGPGTLNAGLYTAPATITSSQIATVTACDADPNNRSDCFSATINLQPLKVEVAAADIEVLPDGETTLTATVTPAASGQELEWTLSPAVGTLTASGNGATYKAPKYDDLPGAYEITVKACLKPAGTVCGTAKVTVPKLLFSITAPKSKLELNETVQVTVVLQGSNVPRAITWKPPAYGILSVINTADPLIRLYKAPGFAPFADVVIEACLDEDPDFCARFPLDLPEPLKLTSIASGTGRWQAGTLTDFTITGDGFRSGMEISFGGLQVTVTSMTETVIKGKVRILVAATSMPPRLKIIYPDGSFASVTSSPIAVEPATVAVVPGTAQVQAGGTVVLGSTCLTSTTLPCTSQEIPSWAASAGSITPAGLNATYTAPATVASQSTASVTACWYHGSESRCAPAAVTLLPSQGGSMSIACSASKPFANHGTAFTWTVTASGGTGTGRQYALFRRRAGTAPWTPGMTAPAWQPGNVLSWTPAAADAGHWEIYIWAKDSGTPPAQNTHGYAADCNPGPVQVLRPITLSATPSPAAAYYGRPITWTATANGADPATVQYSWGRRRVGTADWIPAVQVWQGNTFSWTPASADTGAWEIAVVVKDGDTPPTLNTYGYAAYYNPGQVNVVPPLTVSGTMSPASATPGTALTWTATASGGTSVSRQFAFFRRRSGAIAWTPDVTSPAWQTSNVLSWTPAAADAGTWETFIWVRDSATPPTMNTYGHAAWYNSGTVQIVAAMTLTATPSPAAAYHGQAITWTATASGGNTGTIQYTWARNRVGTATWIADPAGWKAANVLSWTPTSADTGTWNFALLARDANTPPDPGYSAHYNPGQVNVVTPLTLTGTMSPGSATYGSQITWTATASGGTSVNRQYALFRRRSGAIAWTPAVTSPAWQASNVLSWTPTAADAGTWETFIWVKDSATPPAMNLYGHAAWYNSGTVEVTSPVYQSYAPIGYVDGYDRQHVWGWACDPDFPAESNRVDFWSSSWQYLGSTDAHYPSSVAVNSACGGGSAHYFDFYHYGAIPPGTPFMVWAIDLPYATEGGVNVPLGGNGALGSGVEFVIP